MVKEYLSIKEAAKRLGVEYKTVWRLVNDGKLPAAKVRGVWRISVADLDAFFEQQKQEAAETAANRCSACGKRILSALSVGGRCQECEAPICLSCWRIEERRLCRRHAAEKTEPEEATTVQCAKCKQTISSVDMAGGRCAAPDCDALLCVNCWREPDERFCSEHAPGEGEKLKEARRQLEQGEIDRLITNLEAKTREITFISRFDQKVRGVARLRDPVTEQTLRISDWDRCHVTLDDTDRLLEVLGVGFLDQAFLDRVPLNLRSCYRVPDPEEPALVIEAIVVSHLKAHARDGFDTAPITLADVLPYLQEAAARAEETGATHVLGLAATSGWDEEAAGHIRADSKGRSYSHRLLLPYLIDLHTDDLIYNTLDERSGVLAGLFSPQLFGEEVQTVMDYVVQTMLTSGLSSLAANEVTQALSVQPDVVQEAFGQLSSNGEFTTEDISGLGLVIARR